VRVKVHRSCHDANGTDRPATVSAQSRRENRLLTGQNPANYRKRSGAYAPYAQGSAHGRGHATGL
jgi:hypothetical protein